jgi:hypothetical protein
MPLLRLCGALLLLRAPMQTLAGRRVKQWEQMCATTNPQCRVPLDDRSAETIERLHTAAPGAPVGHLKPLGHPDFDSLWDGEIDVLDAMTPEVFWKEYYPHKPFVLRGAGKNTRGP